ncbi:MAG: ABC transporter ATP-binding protein [Dehalococcoidia bacterium]|nr:ABC transporter ATP-binding protein [Dehalococcoidia bacterium]
MSAIRCEYLSKRYGAQVALDGVTIEVPERSIFGFLGPNGSGKTTMIKLLMGMSRPSAGCAWVNGNEVVADAPEMRAQIGYLPDVPNFYDWMRGEEFLRFVGELHHIPFADSVSRSHELLELVGLQKSGKRKIGGYSRGMKQRLGLAQALMNRPKVLFLDEPCSALDPMGRRDVLNIILKLRKSTTVFMSTHILSDVERVCDSLAIINKGKLIATSTVEALRRRFALSSFDLELDSDPAEFIILLEGQSWVQKVEKLEISSAYGLRVQAGDVQAAKQELPQMIAANRLGLVRYEMTMPSLEDIFVQLVEDEVRS